MYNLRPWQPPSESYRAEIDAPAISSFSSFQVDTYSLKPFIIFHFSQEDSLGDLAMFCSRRSSFVGPRFDVWPISDGRRGLRKRNLRSGGFKNKSVKGESVGKSHPHR